MREATIGLQRTAEFLGTVIDRGFSWRQNTLKLKSKCLPALNALRMISGPRIGGSQAIMLRLNDTIILSRLLYGSEVYCNLKSTNLTMIERIYHAGIRLALGAFRTSPIISLLYESGKLSLTHQIVMKNLYYCYRMKSSGHLDEYDILENDNEGHIGRTYHKFCEEANLELAIIPPILHPPPPWSFKPPEIDYTLAKKPRDPQWYSEPKPKRQYPNMKTTRRYSPMGRI